MSSTAAMPRKRRQRWQGSEAVRTFGMAFQVRPVLRALTLAPWRGSGQSGQIQESALYDYRFTQCAGRTTTAGEQLRLRQAGQSTSEARRRPAVDVGQKRIPLLEENRWPQTLQGLFHVGAAFKPKTNAMKALEIAEGGYHDVLRTFTSRQGAITFSGGSGGLPRHGRENDLIDG